MTPLTFLPPKDCLNDGLKADSHKMEEAGGVGNEDQRCDHILAISSGSLYNLFDHVGTLYEQEISQKKP